MKKIFTSLYDPELGELWTAEQAAEHCGIKKRTFLARVYNRAGAKVTLDLPQPVGYYPTKDGRPPLTVWVASEVQAWQSARSQKRSYRRGFNSGKTLDS